MKITNPTASQKTIRIPGGYAFVDPGKTEDIDVRLSAEQIVHYERAGLVFGPAKPEPKTAKEIAAEKAAAEKADAAAAAAANK